MKNKFFTIALTLRGRLFVLICLATLPAVLFTFYIADQERSAALQHARDEAGYVVNLISKEHLYQLTGAKSLLRWLADKMEGPNSQTLASDSDFLAALLAGYPQVANIAILTPDGDVINSAYPMSGTVNMSSYSAIHRALKSREIETGGYVIGPIVGKPLLHLSKAVRDTEGNPKWVVFVAVDLNWLKRLTEQIELPSEHILLVVDRNAIVLANSSSNNFEKYKIGNRVPELSKLVDPDLKAIDKRIGNRGKSFVSVPMEGIPGIFVASALPVERIRDMANQVFYKKLGWLLLLTLCTVFSVLFLEEIALLRYLRALSRASRKFGQGDYSARAPIPQGYGELENMARGFNIMAETLSHRHHDLLQAHERLDKLTRHLQIARESEAQRIARDLHDEIGQVLTSIKMDLSTFQRKCMHQGILPCESNIETIRQKLDGLVEFVRRIACDLRPPVLDRMGIVSAIELLARKAEENSELVVEIEVVDIEEPQDWLTSITVYRIVQEGLTNISRHAEASVVDIKLKQTSEAILLVIKDDGKGFDDTNGEKESLGIIGMQERARMVEGTFELVTKPGKGTVIIVKIPLKRIGDCDHMQSEGFNANIVS